VAQASPEPHGDWRADRGYPGEDWTCCGPRRYHTGRLGFGLADRGVSIVGTVPQGLPSITLPPLDLALWKSILVPALLIAIIGYVESISVALTLAASGASAWIPTRS